MARVLFLTNMYPPHHLGGYELSCRDVVEGHRARGHEVAVLTTKMRVKGVEDPAGERERDVRRDLEMYFRDADLWAPPVWRRPALERHNQQVLRRTLEEVQPDVVSVWHMGAMSVGLLTTLAAAQVPLVFAVCDDWPTYVLALDRWIRPLVTRPRLARVAGALAGVPATVPDLDAAGTFCFVSEATRRRNEEHSRWRFPDSTVVYSGIDRGDFPPVPPDDRPWGWRLLYVGRLDPRKGIETALRALALLPEEATLDVVGRGPDSYRRDLDALVATLGLGDRVRFDAVDRPALAARYAAADVFVFPSEWDEPFGLVPVEAMACETPVVATGTGGSAEFLVDGRNCLRFPPGDAGALAAAVRRLAEDASLRAALRDGGRRTAEELTADRLAETFEAWHLAAADRFRDGPPADRRLATAAAPAPPRAPER